MLNRIVLTGRLTRDPELKTSASQTQIATFTIAVDDLSKDETGKNTTSFINVVVYNQQADSVAKFLRKGALVGVDGRVRQRSFIKKDGTKGSAFEVIANQVEFLEPKGTREVQNEEVIFDDEPAPEADVEESKNLDSIDVTEDDLPF